MGLAKVGCDGDRAPEMPEVPAATRGGENRGAVAKTTVKTKNEKKRVLTGNIYFLYKVVSAPSFNISARTRKT